MSTVDEEIVEERDGNKDQKKKKGKENLKQRAYLNSLTSIIDFAGKQITGFIVSPIIVSGLGGNFYGIWQMLMQMTGFADMADTRATQVLKWTIANRRDVASAQELQREATTALVVTGFILPVVLIVGAIISWYAPHITKVDEQYYTMIRLTTSMMIFSMVIYKIFDLYECILRGMNLGYKRMGVRAAIIVLAGILKVAVIYMGYGIVGLAAVQVVIALVTGITFYIIVKKAVWWYGFARTNWPKIKSYGKLSGWFMALNGAGMIMNASDKILLGYLAGPLLVSNYTLTIFAAAAVESAVGSVINGIIPGIGGLYGKQEYEKVMKARRLIFSLIWLLIVSLGSAVLVLNQSFLALWTGEEFYAGDISNLLIVLIGVQGMFFETDGSIINVTLKLQQKVYFTLASSLVTLGIALLLIPPYGVAGLCMSILLGRMILSIGYPIILRRNMKDTSPFFQSRLFQQMIGAALLFGAAIYFNDYISAGNWFTLFLYGGIVTLVAGAVYWVVGLQSAERKEIMDLFLKIKFFKKDD
ncbi:lipopolysaccharide biosynthesis protein [Litoribacter ruber]|uniref:Lipopolysaccharide biosynthesis protein n=1 Tax=Litoribacter ruber TaxID=702568 RepID=A0AAP2G497_9BACT|nr:MULTISPECIES: lipopolysaccharide biosynthesis protein [Litoribacter]MBS9524270.1 lipopolysaccharide biosynthesis protein [Litoribacter alkaliphilus]MBT0809932.1 lipopolysaccharide biosynthesis protein [Litoribacter ruber]